MKRILLFSSLTALLDPKGQASEISPTRAEQCRIEQFLAEEYSEMTREEYDSLMAEYRKSTKTSGGPTLLNFSPSKSRREGNPYLMNLLETTVLQVLLVGQGYKTTKALYQVVRKDKNFFVYEIFPGSFDEERFKRLLQDELERFNCPDLTVSRNIETFK